MCVGNRSHRHNPDSQKNCRHNRMLPTCRDDISDMSVTDKNVCRLRGVADRHICQHCQPRTYPYPLPHLPALPQTPCRPATHCDVAFHCDLYASHRDPATDSPSIVPSPPLPSPTAIVPPPLPSPIMTPADAHRCRRHGRPSIAWRRSSHATTHPLMSNLTACQGACW